MNANTRTAVREIRATIAESGECVTNAAQTITFVDDHEMASDLDGVDYEQVRAAFSDEYAI